MKPCLIALWCAVVLVAAPASAQQSQAPAPSADQPAPGQAVVHRPTADEKLQVSNFEIFLHGALRSAVQRFALWVSQVAPTVSVTQASTPVVSGFPVSDTGLVFTVQQGDLVGQQLLVLTLQQTRPPAPMTPNGLPRSNVSAQGGGLVTADPMVAPPAPPAAPQPEGCARVTLPAPDASDKYGECVREALINAMLDNSGMLPISGAQTLTVVDIPMNSVPSNRVFPEQPKKLLLSIRADDLAAYRAGKLTRDQAKQKIVETRF